MCKINELSIYLSIITQSIHSFIAQIQGLPTTTNNTEQLNRSRLLMPFVAIL